MGLRMRPVSASRWARLAASRHPVDFTERPEIDLTQPPLAPSSDRGPRIRAELALIQAEVDALEPQPSPANR